MTTRTKELQRGRWYGWLFWGMAALFFLYEFFVRVLPSVVLPEIGKELHADPEALGWSMSAYLWVYAPMQLVVGMLFDRFGTRWLMATATAACALGTLLLAEVDSVGMVGVARGVQGFGSAFAFVGAMYVATVWFAPHRLALIAGMTAAVGMIGQIAGETPLVAAVDAIGLHDVLLWTAGIGVVLALLVGLVIPTRPEWFKDRLTDESEPQGHTGGLWGLLTVVKSLNLWMVGVISGVLYLPLSVMAALWGTTFIENVYGFTKAQASVAITALAVGSLIGCPIAGILSDRTGSRRVPLLLGSVLGGTVALLMLWPDLWTYWGLIGLMFVTGLLTGPQAIVFAVVMELTRKSIRATAVASCNLLTMLIAAGIQVLIGWVLTAEFTAGKHSGAVDQVDLLAEVTNTQFQWAMAVIPAMYIIAIVLCLVIPETGSRRKAAPTT